MTYKEIPELILLDLGERSYPIYVGKGIVDQVGALIVERLPKAVRCAVVTSKVIEELHGERLMSSLREAGLKPTLITVPDGEEAKSWSQAERLIGEFLEGGLNRRSAVVAFGGGAVGDLAGFAASIYLRGINLVQVPTTLLAQVDSSIGGKTAVNHPKGKNLIGVFHQPNLVASDTALLATLPREELLSGLGEVVKHGVIADEGLFTLVEEKIPSLLSADPDLLVEVVRRNAAIKAGYVERDERDNAGVRAALNYGHTTGHALETLTNLTLRHGEAVATGMDVAARISESLGLMGSGDAERQRSLLERLGFDLSLPDVDTADVIETMRRDKKAEGDTIVFVLPTGIGIPPVLRAVDQGEIARALEEQIDD